MASDFSFRLSGLTIDDEKVRMFGAMDSDERFGPPEIEIFDNVSARDEQLAAWSDGLITQRRHRR